MNNTNCVFLSVPLCVEVRTIQLLEQCSSSPIYNNNSLSIGKMSHKNVKLVLTSLVIFTICSSLENICLVRYCSIFFWFYIDGKIDSRRLVHALSQRIKIWIKEEHFFPLLTCLDAVFVQIHNFGSIYPTIKLFHSKVSFG